MHAMVCVCVHMYICTYAFMHVSITYKCMSSYSFVLVGHVNLWRYSLMLEVSAVMLATTLCTL